MKVAQLADNLVCLLAERLVAEKVDEKADLRVVEMVDNLAGLWAGL